MYGKNVVTKAFPQADGSLKVHSIWYTIQGEGPDAGVPAVFIRLSHCNLKCHFCDTQFDTGEFYQVDHLVAHVREAMVGKRCNLVVITGGEPLLQNIIPLVRELNRHGLSVSVETAGTIYQPGLEYHFSPERTLFGKNLIVCSPKTPRLSPQLIPLIGAYKYIVRYKDFSDEDGLPIMSTQDPGRSSFIYRPEFGSDVPIYIQPMDEESAVANRDNQRAAVEICMQYGYRLSVQVHKIVGLD